MCNVCGQTPCNCTHIAESQLTEFAPDDSGSEDDNLRRYARMWYHGDDATRLQVEQILDRQGWEIGPLESEEGGAFVVQAGDEDGHSYIGFTPEQLAEGVAEGAGNIGNAIKALYQKIYAAGDDEIEYFYNDSPIFAQYWDEYEGDLDSIIAEVDPGELQVMLDELESYVQQAGLAEGDAAPADDAGKEQQKYASDTAAMAQGELANKMPRMLPTDREDPKMGMQESLSRIRNLAGLK